MGMGIAAAADGVAGLINTGLGMALQGWNNKQQLKQEGKLQELHMGGQKEMMDYQQEKTFDMWQKTGPVGQMEQLQKAGLNPALMYGMGGGTGGVTTQPSGGTGGSHGAPSGGGEIMAMQQLGLQMKMQEAQIKNLEANTNKTDAEKEKLQGVDTDLARQNKENAILEGIIKQYGGYEAEAQWRLNNDMRLEEYRAKSAEYEARAGAAEQLAKLASEGKLFEKGNQEVQKLINENKNMQETWNLIKENITEKKLSNAILELEKDLQMKTGLDRNSDGVLKAIARLLITMTGE
jgi:hypothetical protein